MSDGKTYTNKPLLTPEAARRKATPVCSGVLDYFPDAIQEVARVSKIGNDQHNPGQPLHWAKEKSRDEADALVRHLLDRGKLDTDGTRHSAKVAWRALALLQREIEMERGFGYDAETDSWANQQERREENAAVEAKVYERRIEPRPAPPEVESVELIEARARQLYVEKMIEENKRRPAPYAILEPRK